jgi:AraC-like DNA-binding protein
MAKSSDEHLRGPLYQAAEQPDLQFSPYAPSADLQFFVEQFWIVRWDLRGQAPYQAEHLPDASVHLVIEDDLAVVLGVTSRKFTRPTTGIGRAFCIKFRPGAFYPFVHVSMSGFTNKRVSLPEVFGSAGQELATAIRAAKEDRPSIEIAERFLRGRHPERDDAVTLIHRIIQHIAADKALTKCANLAHEFHMTERTLQRLFRRYVGVSPGWVIRRYRIHEAVNHLEQGEVVDWPALAVDLGYFDQAHFIKDFKQLIGVSPGLYARRVRQYEHP